MVLRFQRSRQIPKYLLKFPLKKKKKKKKQDIDRWYAEIDETFASSYVPFPFPTAILDAQNSMYLAINRKRTTGNQ